MVLKEKSYHKEYTCEKNIMKTLSVTIQMLWSKLKSFFLCVKNVTLISELDHYRDDLDLVTEEKVLLQGIPMLNMKALSVTIQMSWSMLKFFVDNLTKGHTNRQIDGVKTICPDPSTWGHTK